MNKFETESASPGMSFSVLSKIILARKLTFLAVFVFITASAVAFSLLVTPMFQSEALLMTTLERAQRQQAQFPETLRYQLNSQIYIISSEDVLRQAITEFGVERLFSWHAVSVLHNSDESHSDVDRALLKVKKRLAVSLEKDS